MDQDMEPEPTVEDYSAVIYWVEEKKVGIAPIVLIPSSDRSVGTYTKIRPPGFHKEYVARIEGISADLDELERIQAEVSQRIDAEAANLSEKRPRNKVQRYGKSASEAALQVASGQRRGVPNVLVQENNEVSKAAKMGKASRKAAQSALNKLVHGSLNCNIPKSKMLLEPKNGSTSKSNILNVGNVTRGRNVIEHISPKKGKARERKGGNSLKNALNLNDEEDLSMRKNKNILQVGNSSTPTDFNPNDLMDDSALSEGDVEDDMNCDETDESEIDSLVAMSEQRATTMGDSGHNIFPQKLPVSSPKPHQKSSEKSQKSPQMPSDKSQKSPQVYSEKCQKSPQVSAEKSQKSPQIFSHQKSDLETSQKIPSEGEDFSDDKNKAAFFQFMRLKKMYTPSVKAFLNEIIECFSDEQDKNNSDGEAEYVETVSPPPNERQVEISKGTGVSITTSGKQVILLTGSKLGSTKMLTALVHELFKERLKLIHGTATIRPHVLRAIIAFMEKNSDKATAPTVPIIKRVINNLASEARRARTKTTKTTKDTKATRKEPSPSNKDTTPTKNETPTNNETLTKNVSSEVTTTPSKNTWSVNEQVQQFSYQQQTNQYQSYDHTHNFNSYYDYPGYHNYQYPQYQSNPEQFSSKSPKRILNL